ncbi:hypothetical protein G9G63_25360 [Paenibacillus sp. EKM202P]|uniref:DUF6270 domain-containing protein n=1 Tax=unclassified Paenibacillus TaxID=185978 RepID=UPI0013EB9F5D|nr:MULTISPECIES: DUF6270 domain-containing protein [unclassified Paenibacillus]KAF6558674.1 hypothetical protein G9G63_25360 [Paenibacillus sp. EKM202P]KAF6563858.1 hypothetical protein G9G64_25110 [Paenibacillus sp. EKM207P]
MVLVDVHGSCLSRDIFNVNKDTNISVNSYLSRNNIVSSMMPPANISTRSEELLFFNSEYSHRCLRNGIEKNTVPILLNSSADFLVIDFFDLCQPVAVYKNTTFSTYDYSFYNTAAYKSESEQFQSINFLEIPSWLWYGYIDLYWEKMIEKFGGNIILVRTRGCNHYISRDGEVKDTPPAMLHFGNAIYNKQLYELEEYVINKYNPYVLDVSKYFIADEEYNRDVTPVHFEENYAISSWSLMQNIILNKPKQRYYDNLRPQVVADLLRRRVDERNFEVIWRETESFFVSNDLLDDICLESASIDIIQNRKWLATLYQKVDEVYSTFSDINMDEKLTFINEFINGIELSEEDNVFQRYYLNKLKEKQEYLNLPVEHLVESFTEALDKNDLRWVQMLNCLGILLPEDEAVMYYHLQYSIAVDNKLMITKLKQRLNCVE